MMVVFIRHTVIFCLFVLTVVTSQADNDVIKTRRKRQQSFNANDLIGLLSNLASQSGVGGAGGGGISNVGANLLQQFQQYQQPQQSAVDGGGQGALSGIASGLAQFLSGLRGEGQPGQYQGQSDPGVYGGGQSQYPGQYGGQGQYPGPNGGQGQYPGQNGGYGQQQQPYPGQFANPGGQNPYPSRPYPGGGQYPGRPGGSGGNPGFGQYPGRPGGFRPGGGYVPNPGGAASFTQALTSIAQYDDLRCVPRLLCEVAAGGRPDYSTKQESVLPFISKDNLLTLLTVFNFADTSPLFAFGRAALLGITAKGNPNSCYTAYPTCPRDADTLVNYLNNHNGGFFRFFNNHQQQQQQHQQYAPQYTQQYGQKGQKYGVRGQQNYNQYNNNNQQNGEKYGDQQYYDEQYNILEQQKLDKYGQNGQNYNKGTRYGYIQKGQYGQQYAPYAQYGQQRIQNTQQSATNYVTVTAKPYYEKQTTAYESFPPYADRYATTPRYEPATSDYDYNGQGGRPQGTKLRFPRAEEGTTSESRIVFGNYAVDYKPNQDKRKAKGFAFPGYGNNYYEEQRQPVPMVFPDRTGTGDLRLDTDDDGKTIIFSVSDTGFKVDQFKTSDELLFGKGTKLKFSGDRYRKQRGSKSLMKFPGSSTYYYDRDSKGSKKSVRFPNRYDDPYSRSLKDNDEGEIVAENTTEENGDDEKRSLEEK